jgi:hypothetical protein
MIGEKRLHLIYYINNYKFSIFLFRLYFILLNNEGVTPVIFFKLIRKMSNRAIV